MSPADTLERELVRDLDSLDERLADDEFAGELYRALSNRVWRKGEESERVALSWQRAEDVINALRGRHGHPPLALAQTGGEGEVSAPVDDELGPLGWTSEPLNTSGHEEAHVTSPPDAPPADQGERDTPTEGPERSLREAHERADREQGRRA